MKSLISSLLLLFLVNVLNAGDIKLLGDDPVIFIDGANSSGSVMIHLRNDSKSTANILLNAKNIVSGTTKNVIRGKIQFKIPGSNDAVSLLKTSLKPDSLLYVELEATEFDEAGIATASLFDGNEKLATIHIINQNIPFNLSLETSNPNAPEIIARKGKPALIVIKNQDAKNYLFDWSLHIPEADLLLGDSMVICPANSSTKVSLNVPDELYTSWFQNLFKDHEKQGQLILRYHAPGNIDFAAPGKTIAVKLKLQYSSDMGKYWWGTTIILLVLFMGGIASYTLNLWMPIKSKRLNLLKQLKDLAQKTHAISFNINSDLRVGIRVKRLQLAEMVQSAGTFKPGASQILDGYGQEINVLNQRVDIIQKLDTVTYFFEEFKGKAFGAPARKMDDVMKLLNQSTEYLKLNSPDPLHLTQALNNIQLAEVKLKTMSDEDADFAKELAQSISKLIDIYKDLDKKGSKCEELKAKLKDLFSLIENDPPNKYVNESNITPAHYHWISSNIERLYVLRHYITTWNNYDDRRALMLAREPEFIKYLNNRNWFSLQMARQYRLEFEENVFVQQIKEAIQKKEFYLNISPTRQPKPNETVNLEIKFDNPEFNVSSAKNELECEWDFNKVGIETGWKISHYFRNADEARFSIRLYDETGKAILFGSDGKGVELNIVELLQDKKKKYDGSYAIEIAKFSIAFIIAIIALFTGAKEQILKLDLVSGMIAVFLLGFGADAIKNYLTKNPQQET